MSSHLVEYVKQYHLLGLRSTFPGLSFVILMSNPRTGTNLIAKEIVDLYLKEMHNSDTVIIIMESVNRICATLL